MAVSVVGTLVSIPVQMIMGPFQQQFLEQFLANARDLPPETREMIEKMGSRGGSAILAGFHLITWVWVGAVFGMLGGLLGVALFKKTDLPPPPGTVDVLPPV